MESFNVLFSRFVAEAMISGMRQGLNVDALLSETGVSLSQLHQPDFELPMEVGIYIVYRLYSMSAIPGVALRIGAHMRPSDFGPLGLAMISAPTLAAGLGKLHKAPIGDVLPWEFTLIHDEGRTHLSWDTRDSLLRQVLQGCSNDLPSDAFSEARRYFLEVGLMMARACWIYGGRQVMPTPLYVHLDYPQPEYQEVYQRYFDCPIYFGQNRNTIVFRTTDLLVKPVGANPDLLNYSEQHLGAFVREAAGAGGSWGSRTRAALKHGGIPFLSAEAVAARLNISPRRLRRQLAEQGTSFRQLLQDVREELARQYLQRRELTVAEVASLLGYSETAAFSRSFKQWTGHSPAQFREQLDQQNNTGGLEAQC